MSIILALDSSSREGIVALQTAEGQIFTRKNTQIQAHNAFLLPAIQSVLQEAGLTLPQLDYIACGIGPGSFVGTRLAVSVAQGLAYALRKPVLALNHLHLITRMAQRQYGFAHPVVALDARMQAFYFLDQNGETHFYRLTQLDAAFVADLCASTEKIGDAWPLLGVTSPLPLIELNAADLLDEAQQMLANKEMLMDPSQLLPLYLNDQDHWKKI